MPSELHKQAAGLRQCARGKHRYAWQEDPVSLKGIQRCIRCGKLIPRRERSSSFGSRKGYAGHRIH